MLSLDRLIENGYFPQELPPPFTTRDLAAVHAQLTMPKKPKVHSSKAVSFSIPKAWPSRRILSIPNPLHHFMLCKEVVSRWSKLEAFYEQSHLSLGVPVVSGKRSRAIVREHTFDAWSVKRFERSSDYRFVLKTDISRFYPTIYTHSLPWAIHGKALAKQNKGPALYGNVFDTLVRNTQDQQTIGLPVGPDTSLALSEVIGTRLDEQLVKEVPKIVGIRYADDFSIYTDTRAEAESSYNALARVAKQFELELNPAKTMIFEGPDTGQPSWKTILHTFYIRKGTAQRASILSFVQRSFELAKQFRSEGVLAYAVKKLASVTLEEGNSDLFEAFLRAGMIADSDIIPTVLKVIFDKRDGRDLAYVDELFAVLARLAIQHAEVQNHYEVAWALWCYRVFQRGLPESVQIAVSKQDNPAIALIALDCRDQGLADNLNLDLWQLALSKGNLYSENWLFTYEVIKKGWLTGDALSEIQDDEFFSQIYEKGVSFYAAPEGSGVEYISLSRSYEA